MPDINTTRARDSLPAPAPTDVLQIQENAAGFCGVDGIIESVNGGYSAGGYANTDNAAGAGVRWAVNVPTAGTYSVSFRYASVSDRPATVRVNGAAVQGNVPFTSTGSWTAWAQQTTEVPLDAGNNQLELTANTVDGLTNIDWLQVASGDARAGNCQ